MTRYRITIEYDGTGFSGWQRQQNGPSIQQALEEAVLGFCGQAVTVFGAGRTDAGVHALAQVAHFDLDEAPDPKTVRDALNDHLRRASDGPRHIAVLSATLAGADFDARFSAVARRYEYQIVNRVAAPALDRDRAWHVLPDLDPAAMQSAADVLVGKYDFTTFRSVHCQAKSPVKTLDAVTVRAWPGKVMVTAQARSFLHNQVRAITGTLVKVGEGKWTAADVKAALESLDRARCGPTAPAHGLYLARVSYPGED